MRQKRAINSASTLSVLVRESWHPAYDLMAAGLITLSSLASVDEVGSERLAIGAGGCHTGMDLGDMVGDQSSW